MGIHTPDANSVYPNEEVKQICFIKNVIKNPNILVGDYTYYDDIDGAQEFEKHVTHHYSYLGDKLIIGKFCAIAKGVEFVMNGANHKLDALSTYPFHIMGGDWAKAMPPGSNLSIKGDTIIGNDVWIGQNVTILPGVQIGDGAIIAANSTVSKNVKPYHVVSGNPASIVKRRFEEDIIQFLLKLKWWDWPIEKITKNLDLLTSIDHQKIEKLKKDGMV